MNILLLAPHPFYQERGTPIAVSLLLRVFSERGDRVSVLTYHEGSDLSFPNVTIRRIPRLPLVRNIRPGFSLKKVLCDLVMVFHAVRLTKRGGYDVVHAVEESVFIAMLLKRLFHIPYVYDMDSSMPQQLVEKSLLFKPLSPIMRWCERRAVRGADAVIAVCDALAELARRHEPARLTVLRDVSLLPHAQAGTPGPPPTPHEQRPVRFLYIGNLEAYQGVDLLLRAFALLHQADNLATLTIAGGTPRHVRHYAARAQTLGIAESVSFEGHQPVEKMPDLIADADVLVSPRIKGSNTPMKIYSYLDAARCVLATDLPTHTQVLNNDVAMLCDPTPRGMAEAMAILVHDPELRRRLAQAARKLAAQKYSFEVFKKTLNQLYNALLAELPSHGHA